MHSRIIGSQGLVCPAIALGYAALAGGYGPVEAGECRRIIRHALDAGVTAFDIGEFGDRDERIGYLLKEAIAGARDRATIVAGGGANNMKKTCEAWLRRLDTDHIDLFYLTQIQPGARIEEDVERLAALVRDGKVRYVGLSEAPSDLLRRAHAVHPLSALVSEYSLWHRGIENGPLPTARALGIGVLACRPLGRGFLSGRIVSPAQLGAGDSRRDDARFWRENLLRNARLLPAAEDVAAGLDLSLARLALAWVLSRGTDIVPVPSTANLIHLEMNVAATRLRLTPETCEQLAALFPPDAIAGA